MKDVKCEDCRQFDESDKTCCNLTILRFTHFKTTLIADEYRNCDFYKPNTVKRHL